MRSYEVSDCIKLMLCFFVDLTYGDMLILCQKRPYLLFINANVLFVCRLLFSYTIMKYLRIYNITNKSPVSAIFRVIKLFLT